MNRKPERLKSGSMTLPAEAGHEAWVAELARRWGADFIRDSDGTKLSDELLKLGLKVYSTICLVRDDQEWARAHMDRMPEIFLMSAPVTAIEDTVEIEPLQGFHPEKYSLDTQHDPKEWWEVINRTSGEIVPVGQWRFDAGRGRVVIRNARPFHVYTVNVLCWVIWDTTSMYNHITNHWNKPHVVGVDPYFPDCRQHLMDYFDRWLEQHPETELVRLTTLAYHFVLIWDERGKEKFIDWTGYQETVNIEALKDFEKEYGYRLRSEDFVDEGYYHAANRVPSPRWLDWMDFVHRFVVRFGAALVEKCRRAGKKTGIFWGDHWTGVEPYSPAFQKMGIDAHIGAAEDGVAVRRVSDAPGPQLKELRLYPYFFPDVFHPGGDPTRESQANWIKIRRAILRRPIDRIGYGGYPSLTKGFPEFVTHVEELLAEFRAIKEAAAGKESWKPRLKVLVINAWGRRKAWINSFGPQQKFLVKRQDVIVVAGTNLLECLAGLPVHVDFAALEQIARTGVPDDVDVVLNDGDAETAWSGGSHWANPDVVAAVRAFVHRGGGLLGCRGPSAWARQGRYFQLADVLGVDREVNQGIANAAFKPEAESGHFITAEVSAELDCGVPESFVFACRPSTRLLSERNGHVMLAANTYGKGRSVYFAGLPYSLENARLLHRALFWAAGKEDRMTHWFSENPLTDCAFWPETGRLAVVNNSGMLQSTVVHAADGSKRRVRLAPYQITWPSARAERADSKKDRCQP